MPRPKARKGKANTTMRYLSYAITIALVFVGFVFAELYLKGYISLNALNADTSIELSLFFPSIVFTYLLAKGQRLSNIVKGLGLSRDKISMRNILLGAFLFILILAVEYGLTALSAVTGVPLPTNVRQVLAGLPLYFLVFTFLVAPIDEEILFRGFLVPRVGIVVSALLFAVPHLLTYASVSEFAAAFIFGLLAGYFFKRYKSLYPTILAHALVNLFTILAITQL